MGANALCGCCEAKIEEFNVEVGPEEVAKDVEVKEEKGEDEGYLAKLSQVTQRFQALVDAPEPGFEPVISKEDVKVFSKNTEDGFILRSEWKSVHRPEDFIAFLNNFEERKKWDKNIETVQLVKQIDGRTGLFYQTYKKVMAMSKRDLVYITSRLQVGDAWVDISTSIVHPSYPELPDLVRMNLVLGGYYAAPLPAPEGAYQTRIVCVSDCSFGGSVPKGIVKAVSASAVPTFAKDIAAALTKFLDNRDRRVEGEEKVDVSSLLEAEKAKSAQLARQLKEQSAFISSLLSQRVSDSQARVNALTGTSSLGALQGRVIEAIEDISKRAASQLQVRDKEVERMCTSRLSELRKTVEVENIALRKELSKVHTELQTISAALTDSNGRVLAVTEELAQQRKAVSDLRQKNQDLELARQVLHKQIITLKRQATANTHRVESPSPSPVRLLWTRAATPDPVPAVRSDPQVARLKSALEAERKKLRSARSALTAELERKTALGRYLEDCILNATAKVSILRDNPGTPAPLLALATEERAMLEALYRRAFASEQGTVRDFSM